MYLTKTSHSYVSYLLKQFNCLITTTTKTIDKSWRHLLLPDGVTTTFRQNFHILTPEAILLFSKVHFHFINIILKIIHNFYLHFLTFFVIIIYYFVISFIVYILYLFLFYFCYGLILVFILPFSFKLSIFVFFIKLSLDMVQKDKIVEILT